jgi:hypothetical protein
LVSKHRDRIRTVDGDHRVIKVNLLRRAPGHSELVSEFSGIDSSSRAMRSMSQSARAPRAVIPAFRNRRRDAGRRTAGGEAERRRSPGMNSNPSAGIAGSCLSAPCETRSGCSSRTAVRASGFISCISPIRNLLPARLQGNVRGLNRERAQTKGESQHSRVRPLLTKSSFRRRSLQNLLTFCWLRSFPESVPALRSTGQ